MVGETLLLHRRWGFGSALTSYPGRELAVEWLTARPTRPHQPRCERKPMPGPDWRDADPSQPDQLTRSHM